MKKIILSLCIYLLFTYSHTVIAQVSPQEYEGLVAFYKATGGQNWKDKSGWDINQEPTKNTVDDSWKGIGIQDGHITSLFLSNNNLVGSIPDEIEKLSFLKYDLYLANNKIHTISPKIGSLDKLEGLNLNENGIEVLPEEIKNLNSLIRFAISKNKMDKIPSFVFEMSNLESFSFAENKLTVLPSEIGKLENLMDLYLWENNLEKLPKEITKLSNLEQLNIGGNRFTVFPKELLSLEKLRSLDVAGNQITEVPKEMGNLINLETLDIDENKIKQLPKEIGMLTNLYILDIGENQITELGDEIGNLKKLEILNISGNKISTFPKTFTKLELLESFYFSKNEIHQIPDYIISLPKLNTIHCASNFLNFGDLEKIIKNSSITKDDLSYYSQAPYEIEKQDKKVKVGESIQMTAKTAGENNSYQWFKAGSYQIDGKKTLIQHYEKIEGATNASIEISSITKEQEGYYYCQVENKDFPNLKLKSEPIKVEVEE